MDIRGSKGWSNGFDEVVANPITQKQQCDHQHGGPLANK